MSNAGDVSFGKETLIGVSAKLAIFGFGFVATAFFARALGPAAFGGFYLLLSVVQFANRVPHGLGGACQKRLAEARTSNEEILGLALACSVLAGVLATAGAFLGRDALAAYTGIPDAAAVAVPMFVAVSTFLPLQFLLAGTGRFGLTNWIDFLREIAKTVGQFALVLAGFGAAGMAIGFAAATFLCIPVVLFFLATRPAVPSEETATYVWAYAKYNVPSNVVGKAYTRFDVFLLGWFGLTAAVGYYEVALSLTAISTLISGVVMDGVISRVSNLESRGRPIDDTVRSTISYSSVIAIPMLVLVIFVAEPLVGAVYGAEYLAAVPFLVVVCVYRTLQTQREPLDSAVKGMGRPDAVFRVSGAALALNVALGVSLVVAIGPIGVLVATVAAEGLRWGLLHVVLRRAGASVPVLPAPVRAQLSGAAAMAVAVAATSHVLRGAPGHKLVVAGGVGCLVYVVAIYVRDPPVRRAVRTLLEPVFGVGAVARFRPGT